MKSRVAITRSFRNALWLVSIPESITATATPRPLSGRTLSEPAHTWSAPIASAVTSPTDRILMSLDR
jgi:hypothetical protein